MTHTNTNHRKMESTTITLFDVYLDVEYLYNPAEPPVYYYKDGSGYPGAPEYVEILSIKCNGADLYDFIDGFDLLDKIEEEILEAHLNEIP